MVAGDAPTVDWADLSEKDFELALQTITTVEELNGVANRRRVLNHDFKKWSEVQKCLILSCKFILENEKQIEQELGIKMLEFERNQAKMALHPPLPCDDKITK